MLCCWNTFQFFQFHDFFMPIPCNLRWSYTEVIIEGNKRQILCAVSYTHLDVYKRQVQRSSEQALVRSANIGKLKKKLHSKENGVCADVRSTSKFLVAQMLYYINC